MTKAKIGWADSRVDLDIAPPPTFATAAMLAQPALAVHFQDAPPLDKSGTYLRTRVLRI